MNSIDLYALRAVAESQLSVDNGRDTETGRSADELLHELRVYQIELEMQNEELLRTHRILEESRDRYSQLYDFSPVGFILLSRRGLITESNLTASEFLGVDRSKLISQRFAALISPHDGDRWYLFFANIMKRNQRLTIELSLKDANNNAIPVQLSCLSIDSMLRITVIDTSILKQEEIIRALNVLSVSDADRNEMQQIQEKSLTFLRDIISEERKLKQKSDTELQSRILNISSALPGVIYQSRLHPDGSCSVPYASAALFDIFGINPDDVLTDPSKLFALCHPDDYDGLYLSIKESARDLTLWQHEFRLKFDDGSIKWLFGNGLPQREAKDTTLWNGFITDISERKQLDIDLKDSQFRWKFAIEGAGDGLWDQNLQTNEMLYASCWNKLLGYTEFDNLQSEHNWIPLIHPDDQSTYNNTMEAYLKGASSSFQTEYRLRCKDDSYKWILARGIVVSYSDDGTPLRIIGTHTDITERKYREQKDKEHLDQLAHVTRLGLMGEMASGIAHEVNQPLTAIATYAQVSLNLAKKETPDLAKLAEVATKTQEQALRAGQIINRMKSFCKSKAQKLSLNDINTLINESTKLCADSLHLNNISLTLDLETNLPPVHVDHIQVEQVLINLIRNGIDAILGTTEKRQGQLTIQTHLTPDNEIQVRIKDNGSGIDEDQQQKILMPFHTTKIDGMGMGLSISRSLIEAHNGSLHFKSKFGMGSTFYFTLPIAKADGR